VTPEARLSAVPWSALGDLGPTLEPALTAILSGAAAADVLDRLLRDHRTFSNDQRHVCSEACFGVGLFRRRLAAHLDLPAPPLTLLAVLARDLGGSLDAPALLGVTLPPPRPAPDHWPTRCSVPDWLADELSRAVGDEAPALADALNVPGPVTLRVNRLRTSRDDLRLTLEREGRATSPGRWSPDALHVTSPRPNLTATQAWRDGLFEVQDEGSQLLAAIVPANPTDAVLDLCAGAGGKTLALASRLGPGSPLHAADQDLARLDRVRQRAARAGAVIHLHGATPLPSLRVPHVLVDAPCTELGALRRGPDLRWRLNPSTFHHWPVVQRQLLERAASHLEPRGSLTYATCTLRAEENEHLIAAFLEDHPDFHRERPALPDELLDHDGALRLFPHRHGTDGFYAVVLRRS